MYRVLIVDDDKLTRKGLIASMPWKEYGMEVVGECSNGAQALDFLESHETDLVLTDLEMPVMSGMEFIKKASVRYPYLQFVVLTVHTDFEYIQEALRMGIIDYIAKVQFDKENFDVILQRIADRLNAKTKEMDIIHGQREYLQAGSVYVLLEEFEIEESGAERFLSKNDLWGDSGLKEMLSGIWYWSGTTQNYEFPEYYEGCILLHISQVKGIPVYEFEKALLKYKKEKFFWDYTGEKRVMEYTYKDLLEDQNMLTEDEFQKLKERWISFKWIQEASLFERIKFDMKNNKMTVSKLYHIMLALENAWNQNYAYIVSEKIIMPSEFKSWKEVEEWLYEIYRTANTKFQDERQEGDIASIVVKASKFVEENYEKHILLEKLASEYNISRSYFSICFGKVMGMSFCDYLRKVRIDKAKIYLKNTKMTIAAIAEAIGYEDEKYFSRVFKKNEGISPVEYRKKANSE